MPTNSGITFWWRMRPVPEALSASQKVRRIAELVVDPGGCR